VYLEVSVGDVDRTSAGQTVDAANLHRLLVESVRDYAIFALDPTGHIISWNEGAERIKGYRVNEILGRHFSVFYPQEDRARGKPAHALEVAAAEGRYEDEQWRVRKDGSRFWANVVITALHNKRGELVGFAKVTRDLTERRAATERAIADARRIAAQEAARAAAEERAHELSALLEQMRAQAEELDRQRAEAQTLAAELSATTYSIAHDLRAPLRALDGYSRLLLADYAERLGDEGRAHLERIRHNSQRMGRLIDGILSLARLGRGELQREPVDLSALAHGAAADLRRTEPARDIDVRIAPGLSAHGDPRLLAVVMQNLIGNAWKFTRPKERAMIEVGSDGVGGDQAYFVRDNGVGFDPEFAGQLFRAFQRLHHEDEFEGTGIGLATVKRIVERHGGRVWANGAVGEGAAFYFSLSGGRARAGATTKGETGTAGREASDSDRPHDSVEESER
jgi:PAS domain S-box-containing protein